MTEIENNIDINFYDKITKLLKTLVLKLFKLLIQQWFIPILK